MAIKHILVTGANGQLGSMLRERSGHFQQFRYSWLDINDLDLTDDLAVRQYFLHNKVDYLINCAAYTAVDQAEEQPEQAFLVNADIPARLLSICLEHDINLLHISTDYVYDGNACRPHREDEIPVASSVYGQSKLKGEIPLWDNPRAMIIRTSWLYSEYGNNFLKTMVRISKSRQEIGVVYDQIGTPTYAGELAEILLRIITHSEERNFLPGIYNYSAEGVCSWYDVAVEIMQLTGRDCLIRPLRTSEYPLPAERPAYSVMDKSKIRNTFGLAIPHWKNGLSLAVQNLKKNAEI